MLLAEWTEAHKNSLQTAWIYDTTTHGRNFAGVMELADVTDSKSCSSIHVRLAGTLDITAFPETQEAFDFNIPPAYPSKF